MKNAPTCQDLERPSLDIALNTILLFAILFSYLPQIYRVIDRNSTFGIAPNYVMFNYLFSATQFTTLLLLSCDHYPVFRCIWDRDLKGLDAYGASLGLIQITTQWLGSALMVVLFLRYPSIPGQSLAGPVLEPSLSPEQQRSHHEQNQRPYGSKLITSLCIAHLVIWVLPAIYIAYLSASRSTSWGSWYFMGLCDMICIPVTSILVISQFPSQIKLLLAMGRKLDGSSLSIWTLVFQTFTSILLGISWMYRLGPRGKGYNRVPDGIIDPFTWYYLSSWPYINNIVFGVGQGVLFLICLYQVNKTRPAGLKDSLTSASTDRTALLA